MNVALKIIEDNAKSFKVQRSDGQVIHIAKTPETEPIYRLCKGGAVGYAQGGLVQEAEQLAPLAMMFLNKGGDVAGKVPGKAKVKGDSPKNDTVDAKLSPGELVIPREVVAKGPEAIAAWVKDALAGKHPAKRGGDGKVHAFDGGLDGSAQQLYQQAPDGPLEDNSIPPSQSANFATDQQLAALKQNIQNPAPTPTPPPQQSFGVMAGDQNAAPPPPTTNVDGNGASPEAPQTTTPGGGGSNPYGMVTSTSETRGSTERPLEGKALDSFMNKDVQEYQSAQFEAGKRIQENIAAKATAEANTADEYNQQMAAVNVERNKEINNRLLQIKGVTNKFLGMSVDSNHLYGDSGTGSRIMAGIGLMMGAFGQGLSGQQSPVPGIIERNIDRDIAVQKANIEKAGKDVDVVTGGLKDYMAVTNDMQTATAAEKARQMDMVAKALDAAAAANSDPIVKANVLQTSMGFKEKAVQLYGEVQQNTTSKTTQSMMPHHEAQNADQVNKVQDNIAGKVRSQKLMDILDAGVFDQTGPIKGRIAILKNKFGFSDEDANSFLRNNAQISDQIVHDMAGAKGMQPAEFQSLKGLGPDITSNPKAFRKALQEYHDHAVSENNMIAQSNAENMRYPMDLRAMEDAYVKGTPSLFANKVAFTPQGGHKPKRGK